MTIYTVDTKSLNTAAKIKQARQVASAILDEADKAASRLEREKNKARGFKLVKAYKVTRGHYVIYKNLKCMVDSNRSSGWGFTNGERRLIRLVCGAKVFELRCYSDSNLKVVAE